MFIRDEAAATSQEVTPEGFLRLHARIGRVGLHDYTAAELGHPAGFAPHDTVRVYRAPEDVFDPASMASFAGKPVTDDHPPEMVDAANWRRYAVGHAGDEVVAQGDHLTTGLTITDAAAAARAREGAQLSNGYQADFVFEPGITPAGEPYHAVQRNIRGNHIALVDAGRCGASCQIGPVRTADCACATDESAASPTPVVDAVALDALVAERTAVLDGARRLLGPSFDGEGRSTTAVRRLVVARRLGQDRIATCDDAYVAAAFDTVLALHRAPDALAAHWSGRTTDRAASREAALATRDHDLSRAWQGALVSGVL